MTAKVPAPEPRPYLALSTAETLYQAQMTREGWPASAWISGMDDLHQMIREIDFGAMMSALIRDNFDKKTKTLDLSHNKLKGMPLSPILDAICRSEDSSEMRHLMLNNNGLFGVIQNEHFPQNLESIDLSHNDLFSLTLPLLAILPMGLEHLYIRDNHIRDEDRFGWSLLPKHLRILSVEDNDCQGSIHWDHLPPTLDELSVSSNVALRSLHDKPLKWIAPKASDTQVTFRRKTPCRNVPCKFGECS